MTPRKAMPEQTGKEHGAALLAIMLVVFLASVSYILADADATAFRNAANRRTALVLAEAKAALIGRAASDDNRPGSLLCPDSNNDGVSDWTGSNCATYLGRLPWKTLKLPELVDGNGERLWYAISSNLRDNAAASPINSQQPLPLTFNATPNIAAVVFAPGPSLPGQARPSNAPGDYLEGSNTLGSGNYVSAPTSATFNDVAIAISRDELFRTVSRRVLGEIRGPDDSTPILPNWGLRRYYDDNGTFPWADINGDGLGDNGSASGGLPYNELTLSPVVVLWLNANGWKPLISYNRLSATSASLAIDAVSIVVKPCPSSPCP